MRKLRGRRTPQAALVLGCAVILAVAGCASNQAQRQSAVPPPAAQGAAAQKAAFPYGPPLSPTQYRELVVGNTLFRPLQSGATTLVYVASDQSLKLRIQAPDGKVKTDVGHEVLSSTQVCWQWQRAGKDCFRYYWNGRLITLVDINNTMLPAQFLVQKGNPESL